MNPVLRKDLLGLLRLRRTAAIQALFVVLLAAMMLASWPQGGVLGGTVHLAAQAVVPAQDQMLAGLVIGQIALLVLFVPGLASIALSGEREANTLEMLYASRLSPAQIIGGKVGIAIAFPLLLLISGLPFLALLSWRGDVRADLLLWCYLILILGAMLLAMISLTISALARQSATALTVAYAAALLICGGVMVPAAIMLQSQSGLTMKLLHYAQAVSPVAAALSLLRPGLNDLGGVDRGLWPIWAVFIPSSIALIGICFAVIVWKLRKPPSQSEKMAALGGGVDVQRSLGRKIMFLIDPKKRRAPLGRINPVLGKERRTSSLRSGRWMIRLFYSSLFLSLALSAMAIYGGSEYQDLLKYVSQVLIAYQLGVVLLVTPSFGSASVSGELESGTFEILRMTPLKAGSIFWGKFLPALPPAMLPILAMLPAYGALCFIQPSYLPRFENVQPIVLMAVLLYCVLGLCCSTFVNQTARATVSAYLIASAVMVLPLLGWWAGGAQMMPVRWAKWIAFVSPLVMAMNQLPDSDPQIAALFFPHLWLMGGLCVALLIISWLRLKVLLRRG